MLDVARACVTLQKDLRFHERFRALKRQTSQAVAEEIDNHPSNVMKFGRKLVKLIVMGPKKAGTSTLLNRFVFHNYTRAQRQMFKDLVIEFILKCFKKIINGMSNLPKIKYKDSSRRWDSITLLTFCSTNEPNLPLKIIGLMRKLWDDDGVKMSSARIAESHAIAHFLDDLDRLSLKGYVPSEEDLVMLDIATDVDTDRESSFSVADLHFSAYDISSVYPAVKKLMAMFDEVTCVIFITSLDDYSMTSEKDPALNKMKESCSLFQSVCNSKWFADTPFLIFFSKIDLFEVSLRTIPLTKAFTSYTGSNTRAEGIKYIKERFLDLNANTAKDIYTHTVSLIAYDTWPGEWLQAKISDIIIKTNLQKDGLF